MRLDTINSSLILGFYSSMPTEPESEEMGFFAKMFKRKSTPHINPFEDAIKRIGRDKLVDEIDNDKCVLGYSVDSNRTDLYVVITEHYLILPNQDIIPFENVTRFGLFNDLDPQFAQYAEDRINEPYDPTFVSEYDGEETYELDRFSLLFSYVDNYGLRYKYTIYMAVDDRLEFYNCLLERLDSENDYSSELVIRGEFEDDPSDNPYYTLIG